VQPGRTSPACAVASVLPARRSRPAHGAAISATPVAQTAEPVAVSIVEPPLKPPPTWTYQPRVVTVKLGTKVTWTNNGAVVHTATADDGKTFDSGNVRAKATFSFTPAAPGTFAYHCRQHPWMKGTIIVQR
jgi:plastocyanin